MVICRCMSDLRTYADVYMYSVKGAHKDMYILHICICMYVCI